MNPKMEELWILIRTYREWRVIVDINLLLLNSGHAKSWSETQPAMFPVMLDDKPKFQNKIILSFCQFKNTDPLKSFLFLSFYLLSNMQDFNMVLYLVFLRLFSLTQLSN